MSKRKIRLDHYLVARGLAQDLAHAHSLCVQGLVHDSKQQLTKSGHLVAEGADDIRVKVRKSHNYVARSALKLKEIINARAISMRGKVCADLGCGNGGFTEVLLELGASKVYSVDVAEGIFAHKLRVDPRVVLLENTNVRFLDKTHVSDALDIICCDLSFIGLQVALQNPLSLLKNGGTLLALIKPQFELPREKVGEGGIVRDESLQQIACDTVINWLSREHAMQIIDCMPCSTRGRRGNQEFMLYAKKL